MLGEALPYLGGLLQEVGISIHQLGRRHILRSKAPIEPPKRNVGLLAAALSIKKGCKAVRWCGYQLHVLVQPAAPSILTAVEKDDVVAAADGGGQNSPSRCQVLFVQRLVLLPVSVGSEEHEMWPGKAELVGCHEVGGVDVAKLEPHRADVTSVSALLLWFAVVLRLWFRRFDSGLFSESRGEDELELERRWLDMSLCICS